MESPEVTTRTQQRRGRPKTGRTTVLVSVRLKVAHHAELERRAEKRGETPAMFVQAMIKRELTKRPGEGTRKKVIRRGPVPAP